MGPKQVLHILQSSKTGTSPLDSLVSYLGHLLEFNLFTEMHSAYYIAPAD